MINTKSSHGNWGESLNVSSGKRFMITTAIESSWCLDKPVIFLGEWCRIFSRCKKYNKFDQIILPYHWDNRAKYNLDFQYLEDLYEQHLSHLSLCLGAMHDKTQDVRFWRIIVGPWLRYFIDALFDRFETIRVAYDSGEVEDTWVLKYDLNSFVPENFSDFYTQFVDDPWNHAIFSECIQILEIPYTEIDVSLNPLPQHSQNTSLSRRWIGGLLSFFCKKISYRLNEIAIISAYMPRLQFLKLQKALKQLPCDPPRVASKVTRELDHKKRRLLARASANTIFENFLNSIIPKLIPKAYVENFSEINDSALEVFPKSPKVIVTSNAYQADELFKIWTAHNVNRGVPLVIEQHGGNFGIGRINQSEDHQVKVADIFTSWGWVDPLRKNIKPMPSLKLAAFNPKPIPSGDILVTLASFPRYFYNHISFPVSGQFLNYIHDQVKLFMHLSGPASVRLRIRLDSDSFGWEIKERLLKHLPSLVVETSKKSFKSRLSGCSLSLSTYNATTFLETMASNFPTVVFLRPNFFEIRPEAQEFMNELKSVGILHDSPESAANFIDKIIDDVMNWWERKDVQDIRAKFCNRYAFNSESWIDDWTLLLKDLAKEGVKTKGKFDLI